MLIGHILSHQVGVSWVVVTFWSINNMAMDMLNRYVFETLTCWTLSLGGKRQRFILLVFQRFLFIMKEV